VLNGCILLASCWFGFWDVLSSRPGGNASCSLAWAHTRAWPRTKSVAWCLSSRSLVHVSWRFCLLYMWYLLSLRCFGPVLLYHEGSRSPVPDSACDPSADLQKIWYVESQINFPNLQVVSSTWSWSWKDPTSLDSQLPWQMPARCCQATCSSPRYLSIFAADWIKNHTSSLESNCSRINKA